MVSNARSTRWKRLNAKAVSEEKLMDEFMTEKFWTAERRAWLYKVAVAGVPLLVAIGTVTGDMAQLILNVIAAVLGVGAGGMALTNVTPDNVFTIAVKEEDEEDAV